MTDDRDGDRVLVIVPTYNEADDIAAVIGRVRGAVPRADVLIADDNSPDGTGAIADGLAAADGQVHVLHRPGKQGLGAAYLAGFRWGIGRGYGVLVEMDADGSHRPEELPRLLASVEQGADLALGSRWVPGGEVVNWPRSRTWLSRCGSAYSRLVLGLEVRDVTGGYRAFRVRTLQGIGLDQVRSQGYCFQIEMLRRTVERGFAVAEVPITFVEREHGVSKMNRAIVAEALWRVTLWGIGARFGGRRADGTTVRTAAGTSGTSTATAGGLGPRRTAAPSAGTGAERPS